MDNYLPLIQATLQEWLVLTLANPAYTGAIAVGVFLLTAVLYGFKVSSLKTQLIASDTARIDTQTRLDAELSDARLVLQDTQLQVQQAQETLAEISADAQAQQQAAAAQTERANKLEAQLNARNKQIADTIQTLHTSFDLGERPLPLMGDSKAEGLWQQHERVIALLTTRLRNEQKAKADAQSAFQAEVQKRSEQEALLAQLQSNQAHHDQQLAELNAALEAQTTQLATQHSQAQDALAQVLAQHEAELAHFTGLEQQAVELANARLLLAELGDNLAAKDAKIARLELAQKTHAEPAKTAPRPIDQPPAEKTSALADTVAAVSVNVDSEEPHASAPAAGLSSKLKGWFGKAQPEPTLAPEQPPIVEHPEPAPVEPPHIPEPSVVEPEPAVVTKGGLGGKLKGWLGKAQVEADVALQPEPIVEAIAEPEPIAINVPPVDEPRVGIAGKLKALLGKAPTEPQPIVEAVAESIQPPEPIASDEPPVTEARVGIAGKLKGLLGKAKTEAEPVQDNAPEIVPEAAPIVDNSPAVGLAAKVGGLFAKKTPLAETPPEEPAPQPEATETPKQNALGKLKSLFGKSQ
ncbi:MAG: hypothetical protein HOP34_13585 [Methylococcaceae bacterium]|nr:hypothetical protein [Methylococcaceae bacterium]